MEPTIKEKQVKYREHVRNARTFTQFQSMIDAQMKVKELIDDICYSEKEVSTESICSKLGEIHAMLGGDR